MRVKLKPALRLTMAVLAILTDICLDASRLTEGAMPVRAAGFSLAPSSSSPTPASDAVPRQLWLRQFGAYGDQYGLVSSLVTGPSGDIYVSGVTGGSMGEQNINNGLQDIFVRKYDGRGKELWTRQFGFGWEDFGGNMAVDDSGNVYVISSVLIAPLGLWTQGRYDAFVRKYDGDGNELWSRQFGTDEDDYANAVGVDGDGNVYIAGSTRGTLPGYNAAGALDVFLRKYDSSGGEIWTRQFGTSGNDGIIAMSITGGGKIFTLESVDNKHFLNKYDVSADRVWTTTKEVPPGSKSLTILDEQYVFVAGSSWTAPSGEAPPIAYGFVSKYDGAGEEIWTRRFGSMGWNEASGIAVDTQENVYVVGRTQVSLAGPAGNIDAIVKQYDAEGNELWTDIFGSDALDRLESVGIDSSGSVYIAGTSYGILQGQQLPGRGGGFVRKYDVDGNQEWINYLVSRLGTDVWAGTVHVSNAGQIHLAGLGRVLPGRKGSIYIRSYDNQGNEIQTMQFASGQGNDTVSMVFDPSDNLVIAGSRRLDWKRGDPIIRLAVVKKYDTRGNELWSREKSFLGDDGANALAMDKAGNVYAVGEMRHPPPKEMMPGPPGPTVTNTFIVKYDLAGKEIWTRKIMGPWTIGAVVGNDGYLYIVGKAGGFWIGQKPTRIDGAFISKFDTDGNELWTKQIGIKEVGLVYSAAADGSGDVYVVGHSRKFQANFLLTTYDGFLRKYDRNGKEVWAKEFQRGKFTFPTNLAFGTAGQIYVTGYTDVSLGERNEGFLSKFDSDGNEIWNMQVHPGQADLVSSVAIDTSGRIYIVGTTMGVLPTQIMPTRQAFIAREYEG